jgi:hypothetical protein
MKQPAPHAPPWQTSPVIHAVPSGALVQAAVLVIGWQIWHGFVGFGFPAMYSLPPIEQVVAARHAPFAHPEGQDEQVVAGRHAPFAHPEGQDEQVVAGRHAPFAHPEGQDITLVSVWPSCKHWTTLPTASHWFAPGVQTSRGWLSLPRMELQPAETMVTSAAETAREMNRDRITTLPSR